MARKSDIQYIQFYTDGSAARQFVPRVSPRQKLSQAVRPVIEKERAINIYPLEICAVAVSVVMLVLMVAGIFSLRAANAEMETMQAYVQVLQAENSQLQAQHDEVFDLEAVEQTALAIGMVPVEQAQQIPIQVAVPVPAEEPSFWENIGTFLTGLFA